jgi:hypothetical protein
MDYILSKQSRKKLLCLISVTFQDTGSDLDTAQLETSRTQLSFLTPVLQFSKTRYPRSFLRVLVFLWPKVLLCKMVATIRSRRMSDEDCRDDRRIEGEIDETHSSTTGTNGIDASADNKACREQPKGICIFFDSKCLPETLELSRFERIHERARRLLYYTDIHHKGERRDF